MDSGRFDALAKTFPGGARRRAVRVLSVVPLAGLLASLLGAREQVQAGKRKKKSKPGQQGPAGPQGPAGTFGTLTKRDDSTGLIVPGEYNTASPQCLAGETPVSVSFRCDLLGPNIRAYATVLTLTATGAEIGVHNPNVAGAVGVSCRGEVLCAS